VPFGWAVEILNWLESKPSKFIGLLSFLMDVVCDKRGVNYSDNLRTLHQKSQKIFGKIPKSY
jgi:hypothetical protein